MEHGMSRHLKESPLKNSHFHIMETEITGVFSCPLAIFPTPNGSVLHMLKRGNPLLPDFSRNFGEIYFSEVYSGHIKAWKQHKEQTQLFAVPYGCIKLVIFDGRENSPSYGRRLSLLLGRPGNYNLLQIPPLVWYGFEGVSPITALLCNCASIPHDPAESITIPRDDPNTPCVWPHD